MDEGKKGVLKIRFVGEGGGGCRFLRFLNSDFLFFSMFVDRARVS